MAETIMVEGQPFLKRHPLGVLGLSFITLGIYFLYWYYKINEELRRARRDPTISPVRSLMAVLLGWVLVVPPFIAMWNTAKHVQALEEQVGVRQTIEPAIVLVIMFVFSIGNATYIQEHLNRAWDTAAGGAGALPPPPMPS
jgi:amino acid transporter